MHTTNELFRQGHKTKKLPYTRLPQNAMPTFESPFVVNIFNQEIGSESVNHVHPGVEIQAITNGSATVSIDDMEYSCETGDFIFNNAMVPHALHITQTPFASIFCHIGNNTISALPPPSQSLKLLNLFFVPLTNATPVLCNQVHLIQLLKNAYALYIANDSFGKLKSWSIIVDLLANLAGVVYPFQESTSATENRNHEKILMSLSYIHENYPTPKLRIEELASVCSMSESHFNTTFLKVMKIPVHEYLNRVRINSALEQLNSTTKKIEQICFDSGFQNFQTFYYIFKKITGHTPTFFRKK